MTFQKTAAKETIHVVALSHDFLVECCDARWVLLSSLNANQFVSSLQVYSVSVVGNV